MPEQRRTFLALIFMLGLLLWTLAGSPPPLRAELVSARPADVYARLLLAKQEVELLRREARVRQPWPRVQKQPDRYPRHVLQKCYEVLEKINRLRNIEGMGPITIPQYPTRKITPNEVLTAAKRMLAELRLLTRRKGHAQNQAAPRAPSRPVGYADNYAMLQEISLALDPVMGVRGFSPDDVYAQSIRVLNNTRFLRMSQNLSLDVAPPPRGRGGRSNHALLAAVALLAKIARAEHNLWMKPCRVPKIPRRRIEPNEVYDSLQIVLAELQRIKYRLGLERHFPIPAVQRGKTPDDVIRNLKWATALLPEFSIKRPLIQYDPATLSKTPNDVFLVAEQINRFLVRYRRLRGIRVPPRDIIPMPGRQPKHVYQKTLECLWKVNRLRKQLGMGPTAMPEFPLRRITPNEVYDLAVRLRAELFLIEQKTEGKTSPPRPTPLDHLVRDKTPSDVYHMMWQNLTLLDTVIGPQGYTPNDVYRQSQRIIAEFKILRRHLQVKRPVEKPPLKLGKEPRHVLRVTQKILRLLRRIQKRAGMSVVATVPEAITAKVTPNEVFNEVGIILAELVALKVHLGITSSAPDFPLPTDKTPSHVYRNMEYARRLLATILE